MKINKGKIGVFDSGFGGLSILKEIVKVLPNYNYIYLGDTARTPYGNRSQEIIYKFTKEGIDFLFKNGAEIIILACNTASSEALRKIQQEYLPEFYNGKKVLGVVIPASEEAVTRTRNKRIGVLATVATVASGSFKREIQKIDKMIKVYEVPAPLLVPIVEAGEDNSESARMIIKKYVKNVSAHGIDTLILGCTHYGILEREIKKNVTGIKVVSEGKIVAQKLKSYLDRHGDIKAKISRTKHIEFCTTDSKGKFDVLASRFFGKKIRSKTVEL